MFFNDWCPASLDMLIWSGILDNIQWKCPTQANADATFKRNCHYIYFNKNCVKFGKYESKNIIGQKKGLNVTKKIFFSNFPWLSFVSPNRRHSKKWWNESLILLRAPPFLFSLKLPQTFVERKLWQTGIKGRKISCKRIF